MDSPKHQTCSFEVLTHKTAPEQLSTPHTSPLLHPSVSAQTKPVQKSTSRISSTKTYNRKKKNIESVFASLYDDSEEQIGADSSSSGCDTWSSDLEIKSVSLRSERVVEKDDAEMQKVESKMEKLSLSEDGAAAQGGSSAFDKAPLSTSVSEDPTPAIRTEWLGSSQFYVKSLIEMQKDGILDGMVKYREAIVHDLTILPYNPSLYIELALVEARLGFSDIAASNAYRALVLIESVFSPHPHPLKPQPGPPTPRSFSTLRKAVSTFLSHKYPTHGPLAMKDEIAHLHVQAYQALLTGLVGSAAFWDGLIEAEKARALYPHDAHLAELQADLKAGFLDRCELFRASGLPGKIEAADLVERTRSGKIYQVRYPWVEEALYRRTPATLRAVQEDFREAARACEVRPVAFGGATPKRAREGEDVGPLGIFATRDIKEGELVILDKSITGVSNVPSSKLLHCDACHGSLAAQYLRQAPLPCAKCKKVAYCSPECYTTATTGYHKILCGHELDWVYEHPSAPSWSAAAAKTGGVGFRWKAVLLLRVMAIILTSPSGSAGSRTPVHPLQHPLIARAAANYAPPGSTPTAFTTTHEWHFASNSVSPTLLLLQLGVDIFAPASPWTPATIQTILWRLENNADMAATVLGGTHSRLMNYNARFLFLNHCCEPNTSWHGAPPDGEVDVGWLAGFPPREGPVGEVELLQPGCSAVWCSAARDVKEGEELNISYVGDPLGLHDDAGVKGDPEGDGDGEDDLEGERGRAGKRAWLDKWFDRGCGCAVCEGENAVEDRDAALMRALEASGSV